MPIRPVDSVGTSMAFQFTMSSIQTVSFLNNKNWLLESPICFFGILLTLTSSTFLSPILLNDLPRGYDSISIEKYVVQRSDNMIQYFKYKYSTAANN